MGGILDSTIGIDRVHRPGLLADLQRYHEEVLKRSAGLLPPLPTGKPRPTIVEPFIEHNPFEPLELQPLAQKILDREEKPASFSGVPDSEHSMKLHGQQQAEIIAALESLIAVRASQLGLLEDELEECPDDLTAKPEPAADSNRSKLDLSSSDAIAAHLDD